MDTLPDVILEKIFNLALLEDRLLSLWLVCRRWDRLMPFEIFPRTTNPMKLWKTKPTLDVSHMFSFVKETRPSKEDIESDFGPLASVLWFCAFRLCGHLGTVKFTQSPFIPHGIRAYEHMDSLVSVTPRSVTTLKDRGNLLNADSVYGLPFFYHLQTLVIKATEANMETLAEHLPELKLRKLRIDGVFNRDLILGDASAIIRVTIPSLAPFEKCLAANNAQPLPQQWPNLRYLNCSSKSEIDRFSTVQLRKLLGFFPSLRRSNIIRTCYGGDLTDALYQQPCVGALEISTATAGLLLPNATNQPCFQNMTKLSLSGCQLGSADVSWIWSLPNLLSLKFDYCYFIPRSTTGERSFSKPSCKNLKALDWREGAWSEMKSLFHMNCSASYESLNSEADFVLMDILSACDRLESIFIDSYSPDLAHRLAIFGQTCRKHRLRDLGLRLSGTDYLKTGLEPLITTVWPSVRNLIFVHEGKLEITDETVINKFGASFPNLRSLTFREPYVGGPGTEIIPFESATALLRQLPKLETLSGIRLPYDWPSIKDFFQAVAEHQKLENLVCRNLVPSPSQQKQMGEILREIRDARRKVRLVKRFSIVADDPSRRQGGGSFATKAIDWINW